MAGQTLDKKGPQIAWAIFLDDLGDGDYLFHSAHWSKTRARDMLWGEWKKPKIVKIYFTFDKPPNDQGNSAAESRPTEPKAE